ncbi:MAG TPA: glycerol-3-phosphate dehydrogenase [Gammaproteobacteria bacterium]|nr:glycerol-3-phosphate dehydrogenase [Gammaproteobacteria bacterium]
MSEIYDLLVVGGGVNGCGVARDAAGRGLRVLLCETGDLAGQTSSRSTKLIHGGLRYLEHYEFRLVREALQEREVLLAMAPHLVWPMRFVLPHNHHMRPAWMIRVGMFLYDYLAGRKVLKASRCVSLSHHKAGAALKDDGSKGFIYSDCATYDSRLVVLNAIDAAEHGATILTRTQCLAARRQENHWIAALQDVITGRRFDVTARSLVNATGPWVNAFIDDALKTPSAYRIRLIKGSHMVVPRLFEHNHAYILQHSDQRIIFVIPFEQDYSLIGTTEVDYDGDPTQARMSEGEVDYLCGVINSYFKIQTRSQDVVWTYAGVRPLFDDATSSASAVSREYILELDNGDGRAPLVSVFGGKLTAYRQVAEHTLSKLLPAMKIKTSTWTSLPGHPLPGGDLADFATFVHAQQQRYGWLPEATVKRLARLYGTRIRDVVGTATSVAELGQHFGADLYEAEVLYLLNKEWARTAEDILWRRTRLGLYLKEQQITQLQQWLDDHWHLAA